MVERRCGVTYPLALRTADWAEPAVRAAAAVTVVVRPVNVRPRIITTIAAATIAEPMNIRLSIPRFSRAEGWMLSFERSFSIPRALSPEAESPL